MQNVLNHRLENLASDEQAAATPRVIEATGLVPSRLVESVAGELSRADEKAIIGLADVGPLAELPVSSVWPPSHPTGARKSGAAGQGREGLCFMGLTLSLGWLGQKPV